MLSLEGKQLGNYDVIRRIRVGGMGAVYEGRQRTAFDRRVAIKVILGDYARDKDMRRRFAREARTIARLHHPHILQLIEFGDEQGVLFLVMPFIEGGTLTSYLRRSLPDLEEVSALYQQLLDAVEYAHEEGLIHRDIKSSNVLLEMRRNAAPYLYLADFGLVRTMRQTESSQSGKAIPLDQVPGTPHYMAPEQTRGIVTPLTDIYALGVLLYQMLTGELPYNDDDDVRVIQMHLHAPIPSPCAHDASIPAELGEVVRVAMAKRPEERYRSVADLRRAFLTAVKGPSQPLIEKETEPELREARFPTPPSLPRRSPAGRASEIPEPIIIPRRLRPPLETPQPTLHEVHEWQEQSLSSRPVRHKVRNSGEVQQRGRRRWRVPLLVALLLVPIFLSILLLVPRIFGINILPVGFPIFGASPVATIYITAQTKQLQDTYLITASQDVKTANQAAHTIPDRVLSQNAASTVTVNTTGLKISAGVAAQGLVAFTNSTHNPIQVPNGLALINSAGIHIQILQAITVPGNQTLSTTASATSVGQAGNIAVSTLIGICCKGLSYRNYAAFSGGVDGQTTHYVTQADLDGVIGSQQPKLQQKVSQQIQSQLGPDEAVANQPLDYTTNTTSNIPVNTEAQQVQVVVNVVGSATIYSRSAVSQIAIGILNQQAANTLNKAYQIQDKPTLLAPPKVAQVKNGVISFDVSVRGTWVYTFTSNQTAQWLQPIEGSTKDAAQAYLKTQPGISSVEIHLPFGSSQLPTSTTDIQIILLHSSGT